MPRDKMGNPAHSFGRARLNDEMEENKRHTAKVVNPRSRAEGHQPDPDSTMEESSAEDIRDVVAEHGPAKEVHSYHDHEGGKHHVTTYHGEHRHGKEEGAGFTHHSNHASAEEAHTHIGKALGVAEENEDEESPEARMSEEKMPAMHHAAHAIPGMA